MNEKRSTKRFSLAEHRPEIDEKELAELQALREWTDEEVERRASEDPDAQPAEKAWLMEGEIVEPKVPISIRLDREVVDYFKGRGRGYQSRINAVLKKYVQAHNEHKA